MSNPSDQQSLYLEFLESLFRTGHVMIGGLNEPTNAEITQGVALARELEWVYRQELPGSPPTFQPEPFSWAAVLFYRATQFLIQRDVPAEVVRTALSAPFPNKIGHAEIYSVDFVFRFLPDLLLLAHGEAADDPLTRQIQQWITEWPLTAAGSPTATLSSHPTLCRMYVERWLRTGKRRAAAEVAADPRIRLQLELELGTLDECLGSP